uniref:Gametocyte-specific factor 1-like n=1 Tax=Phascolarctos cinereus TaxID=38626 RepID=A0A6P5IT89_PHACI|nr:gametocyte-specific factor 1-like [Phascolarctos cinereus]
MDPDDKVQCPYDPSHFVSESRMQYHLAQCKKKNPKKAKEMASCKYNARHVVPRETLQKHEAICQDKIVINKDKRTEEPKA